MNSRKPWQKSDNSPHRIRGRALLARNARVKLRDGYRCAKCGRIANDHDVDHKVPLHQGGKDEDANCQLLCTGTGRCHEQKSAQERGQRERIGCDANGYPIARHAANAQRNS
jgi:5-methylcytosine-specific restriction protein A